MKRLNDPADVKRYVEHPEIYQAICNGVPFDQFTPTIGSEDHFIVTAPESMFYLHPFCADVWQIHAHVHPDYRCHAVEAANAALIYGFHQLSALKVVALIPEVFPSVIGFAKKCGLSEHGYIPDSYLNNSKLVGQFLLGISRHEFEELNNGLCT